ncbi:MAG: ATP-grasp domain-containing protein [Candidatus Bathyarchaeia archaeon]|nr:acetate--CoA ligase family protein [Candidatus Bathyarchaeota archaeon]
MPYLLEYEAKQIFRKEGLPIPEGEVAETSEQAKNIAERIGKPVVVKIQIPTGRRGRAGGVKLANNAEEAEKIAKELLGKEFLGHKVNKVLVEEKLNIKREFYIGVVNDRAAKSPAILMSSEGGMEIEEITQKFPEKLAKINVNIFKGLQVFQVRNAAKKVGIPLELINNVSNMLYNLYWKIYRKYDATFTEINPLCLTNDGKLIAADARLSIDDDAMFRHKEITPEAEKHLNEREKHAKEKGYVYVELDPNGEIACISNGAGLGMSVMDYVNEAGGKLACFMDVGGRFYELAGDALKTVLTLPNLKAVLFHVYAGLTRANIIAKGVCEAIKEVKPKVPIFIQVSGTGEKGAIEIMKKESEEFRKMGLIVEWCSHTVTGKESPLAHKGGVDTIEIPVKRVLEWCGIKYKRNPPEWLPEHPEWEKITREIMRKTLPLRPEPEYNELAKYE